MATVFLANDRKLRRPVALKVLKPTLAATLAVDRFLREIRIAAGLSNPHILPLHDSGDADGFLFYVTPFVEGETLRERLECDRTLSVDRALEIAHDVAVALGYSHSLGVVHRDVKPANILLSRDEAIVADFGIAHAIHEAGDDRLTETGFAVGTTIYMAPEQTSGVIDGRADIYSLGCVLYEMLAGRPPFRGANRTATLAQHAVDPIPDVRLVRPDVPDEVHAIIIRSLAKNSGDRFATAAELADALRDALLVVQSTGRNQVPRSSTGGVWPSARRALRRRPATVMIGIGLLVAVAFAAPHLGPGAADGRGLAVLPFTIVGSVDTTLVTPEGLAELIGQGLDSDDLPVISPRVVQPLWRAARAAGRSIVATDFEIARDAGAAQMLTATATGTSSALTLKASIHDVASNQRISRAEASGLPDSLLAIADTLIAKLLIERAGEDPRRVADLLTGNLGALRVYLSGVAKFRRGRYDDAIEDLSRALVEDSTFALAAMELASAHQIAGNPRAVDSAEAIAWRHRHKLSRAGKAYLTALLGPRYPATSGRAESIRAWELAIGVVPDRAEAWYFLGDFYFHWGPVVGLDEPHTLARNAFARAIELDGAFAPALEHLLELAVLARDTAEVRRITDLYLTVDSLGDNAAYVRWRRAVFLNDHETIASIRARFEQLSIRTLERIAGTAQLDGIALGDAAEALRVLRVKPDLRDAQLGAVHYERHLLLNRGRPGAAATRVVGSHLVIDPRQLFHVAEALFWDADSALAARAVAERAPHAEAALGVDSLAPQQLYDVCVVGIWGALAEGRSDLERHVRALRSVPLAHQVRPLTFASLCAATLDAWASARTRRSDAGAALARLDSLARSGLVSNPHIGLVVNMVASRLYEERSDFVRAVAAVRRRPYDISQGPVGLAAYLRAEGRLAALAGDTAGARSAYRRYLSLRADPEPSLARQVAAVRAALDSLDGGLDALTTAVNPPHRRPNRSPPHRR
jgi:serine/threonine-protein kinase